MLNIPLDSGILTGAGILLEYFNDERFDRKNTLNVIKSVRKRISTCHIRLFDKEVPFYKVSFNDDVISCATQFYDCILTIFNTTILRRRDMIEDNWSRDRLTMYLSKAHAYLERLQELLTNIN